MPELPEVEAVARTLRPLLCGRRIRCAEVLHPIVTRPQTPALIRELSQGQCIEAVWRRGKYLFLELKRGLVEMHFRFDGQLLWFASARELRARTSSAAGLHVDVIFELDSGVLGFIDPRHLGRVHVWESAGDCAPLSSLGIDALSRTLTAEALHAQISSSKLPLKEFLLNQKKIAGIGNIYSCEALWQARLDPRRSGNSLDHKESGRLHKAIVSVLKRALECCLDPAPDFSGPQWWFQGPEEILRVYQREGLSCRRCGGNIRRIVQGGRSTYCCLNCQK
jgi:formamidopyrimidine-DNA glycosylase